MPAQYNGGCKFPHRTFNYFWRKILEQKPQMCLTNAWLVLGWWVVSLGNTVIVVSDEDAVKMRGAGLLEDGKDPVNVLRCSFSPEVNKLKSLKTQNVSRGHQRDPLSGMPCRTPAQPSHSSP